MSQFRTSRALCSCALAATLAAPLAPAPAAAAAGWSPVYSIQRLGLTGPDHTGSSGIQDSGVLSTAPGGHVAGYSQRFAPDDLFNGYDLWAWNGAAMHQVGLTGGAHTGSEGFQSTLFFAQNAAGHVIGVSQRVAGVADYNGGDAWLWNGASTQQIGFTGAEYTGSAGFQNSAPFRFLPDGRVLGFSQRFAGVSDFNGLHVWVSNGASTQRIGLTGPDYTGAGGLELTDILPLSDAANVVGFTNRFVPGTTDFNGQDVWVWNGVATQQTGLTGPGYISGSGYQYSNPTSFNQSGLLAGYSERYTAESGYLGLSAWAWNGVATQQIGLIGAENTSPDGFQHVYPTNVSEANVIVGFSERYAADSSAYRGRDAWAWNGAVTEQIGLTTGIYLTSAGFRESFAEFLNASGHAAGYSRRFTASGADRGSDAWVWDGTTTQPVGLFGPFHTTVPGVRFSDVTGLNDAGVAIGYTRRFTPAGAGRGTDAWVWDGAATHQIGLVGPDHTTAANFQESYATQLNNTGLVAGGSIRFDAASAYNGEDAWIWNGASTQQIGLTGGDHTGSAGYQRSSILHLTDPGRAAGFSERFRGVAEGNGVDVWVWDGAATQQIGLTGPAHSGSEGYRYNDFAQFNQDGVITGATHRIFDIAAPNGQDAWYFDPVAASTFAITDGAPDTIRLSDQFAHSQSTLLTDDGYALGNYLFFEDGLGDGDLRAFAYRPDRGFTDLGDLVSGGLTAAGWSTLVSVTSAELIDTLVGFGYVNGQTTGQSVFIMNVPAPGAATVLLALATLLPVRRRRALPEHSRIKSPRRTPLSA